MQSAATQGGARRSWALLTLVFLVWIAGAWMVTGRFQEQDLEAYLSREKLDADRDVRIISIGLAQSWDIAEGLVTTLATQDWVQSALLQGNGPSTVDDRSGRRNFLDDPQLAAASRNFFALVNDIKIISILSLLNRQGDCIAASNGASLTSLIGNNYADRRYFTESRQGGIASEFATGRATNQPGLFMAMPISHDKEFAGAIMAKFDSGSISPWLNLADSFIADDNGVIIFARDISLLFKVTAGATVDQLDDRQRVAVYKRNSFTALPSTRWNAAQHPEIIVMDERAVPVILATMPLSLGRGTAGVVHPLPRLPLFDRDRWQNFLLMAGSGILLLSGVFLLWRRLEDSLSRRQAAETEAALHQSVIDAAGLAIAVYAEDGVCVAANDAMAQMLGTGRDKMIGHNFRAQESWLESGLTAIATQVLEQGAAQRGQWRLATRYGQDVWVEATLKRFVYQSRPHLLAIFIDATAKQWSRSRTQDV